MSKYRNYIRICGRDFNMDFIESIEIYEAINPGHAVVTIEYKDKSITYPITGTVQENRDKLDRAYRVHYQSTGYPLVDTFIDRR